MKKLIFLLILLPAIVSADSTLFVGTAFQFQRADSSAPQNTFSSETNFKLERDNSTGQEWSIGMCELLGVRDSVGTNGVDSIICSLHVAFSYLNRDGYMIWQKCFKPFDKDDASWNSWDHTSAYEWTTEGARCEYDAGTENTVDNGPCSDASKADRKVAISDSVSLFHHFSVKWHKFQFKVADSLDNGDHRYILRPRGNLKMGLHNDEYATTAYRGRAWVYHSAAAAPDPSDPSVLRHSPTDTIIVRHSPNQDLPKRHSPH